MKNLKTNYMFPKGILGIITLLLFLFSMVNAQDWEPDVHLVQSNSECSNSVIKTFENFVHVVWIDYRDNPSQGEVYYKRSLDNGQSWEPGRRLTDLLVNSTDVSMAVFADNVHIVWTETIAGGTEIYYLRSTNFGQDFHPEVRMTYSNSQAAFASVALFENNIHLVWEDYRDGNTELYYKNSFDNGNSWSPGQRLTNSNMLQYKPKIAVFESNVYIVYCDNTFAPLNGEVFFKRSLDNGNTWGPDTQLTNSGASIAYPTITNFDDRVYIAWEDYRHNNTQQIYFRQSFDSGLNWEPEKRISNTQSRCLAPSISAFWDNVFISWNDIRTSAYEIYFKMSDDNGINWGITEQITFAGLRAIQPSISVFDRDIYLAWSDFRDGNSQIYFKRAINLISTIENISAEPSKYKLEQNYPNPFNPATIISFSIPQNGEVKLVVYDLLGNEVEELVNQELAAGTYEQNWNASGLSSGIYFYSLSFNGNMSVKKMNFIK